jgi:hypothetical protein
MQSLTAFYTLLVAAATVANAHNIVTHFHVNGKADQSCVNLPSNANPITDIQSQQVSFPIIMMWG